ncbi:hypothetical protein MKZ38_006578 [Zalerion maritima]|uniref:Uncharacterized protein n=1 Tax=Zalerion maritima TaxID=339359 RepID=A0AAD5RIU6_9PEZI|nr:hypothetical protein MKZ38_006578 [Zalerion maritima]
MASIINLDLWRKSAHVPGRSAPRPPTTPELERGTPGKYYTLGAASKGDLARGKKVPNASAPGPGNVTTASQNVGAQPEGTSQAGGNNHDHAQACDCPRADPGISLRGGKLGGGDILKHHFSLNKLTRGMPSLVYRWRRGFLGSVIALRLAQMGAAIAAGVFWIFVARDIEAHGNEQGAGNSMLVQGMGVHNVVGGLKLDVPTGKFPAWVGDIGNSHGRRNIGTGNHGNLGLRSPMPAILGGASTVTITEIVWATGESHPSVPGGIDPTPFKTATTITVPEQNGIVAAPPVETSDTALSSSALGSETTSSDLGITPIDTETPTSNPSNSTSIAESSGSSADTDTATSKSQPTGSQVPGEMSLETDNDPFSYLPTTLFPAGWLLAAAFVSLFLLVAHIVIGFGPRGHAWVIVPDILGAAFWILYSVSLFNLDSSFAPIYFAPSRSAKLQTRAAEAGNEEETLFAASPRHLASALVSTAFAAFFFTPALLLDLYYLYAMLSDKLGWTTPTACPDRSTGTTDMWNNSNQRREQHELQHLPPQRQQEQQRYVLPNIPSPGPEDSVSQANYPQSQALHIPPQQLGQKQHLPCSPFGQGHSQDQNHGQGVPTNYPYPAPIPHAKVNQGQGQTPNHNHSPYAAQRTPAAEATPYPAAQGATLPNPPYPQEYADNGRTVPVPSVVPGGGGVGVTGSDGQEGQGGTVNEGYPPAPVVQSQDTGRSLTHPNGKLFEFHIIGAEHCFVLPTRLLSFTTLAARALTPDEELGSAKEFVRTLDDGTVLKFNRNCEEEVHGTSKCLDRIKGINKDRQTPGVLRSSQGQLHCQRVDVCREC